MKRLSINVDLDDNEILDNQIKKLIVSQAKQIAREELERELILDIERITNAKIEEAKNPIYKNAVADRVTEAIAKRLDKEINLNSQDIDQIIQNKINHYLDKKIQESNGFDEFIQEYLAKSIASLLQKANN